MLTAAVGFNQRRIQAFLQTYVGLLQNIAFPNGRAPKCKQTFWSIKTKLSGGGGHPWVMIFKKKSHCLHVYIILSLTFAHKRLLFVMFASSPEATAHKWQNSSCFSFGTFYTCSQRCTSILPDILRRRSIRCIYCSSAHDSLCCCCWCCGAFSCKVHFPLLTLRGQRTRLHVDKIIFKIPLFHRIVLGFYFFYGVHVSSRLVVSIHLLGSLKKKRILRMLSLSLFC